ncbi:MAG: type I-C CRISPR-associated protein Cas7/Csd2 [Pseudomonadota bacterium]
MTTLANRYDFVLLFDVQNGNPNGDPDAGNLPRMDPETSQGLVSDVCIKRKIRNYVAEAKAGESGHEIYMAERAILNDQHRRAYAAEELPPASKKLPKKQEDAERLTRWMCANFFDIRTFGAVMTTDINCGQVRGPLQFSFGRSLESVLPMEISITRSSVTNEKDAEKERTMGRKHIVPYGLYRMHGYINAKLAKRTGFSEEDLTLVKHALLNLFELDRSAARGEMATRHCFFFRHDSALGNAPAHKLFERVTVERRFEGETAAVGSTATHNWPAPRAFSDYQVTFADSDLPSGITAWDLTEGLAP